MPDATAVGKRPPLPEPLPRPVIDSHCHIDMRGGDEDELSPADAVAAAASVNVTGIVQVGCSIRDVHAAVAMAEENPAILAAIGIHPNEAPRLAARGELDAAIATVEQLAVGSPRVRGIGETGLDFFRTREPEAWVDPGAVVPGAHRHGSTARARPGDPRPRLPRRCHPGAARRAGRRRAAGRRGVPLLLRRRADGPDRRRARLVRVVRRDGHVHQRPRPARRGARRAARPDPRRDRRAVPDAHARTAAGSTPATWCR